MVPAFGNRQTFLPSKIDFIHLLIFVGQMMEGVQRENGRAIGWMERSSLSILKGKQYLLNLEMGIMSTLMAANLRNHSLG